MYMKNTTQENDINKIVKIFNQGIVYYLANFVMLFSNMFCLKHIQFQYNCSLKHAMFFVLGLLVILTFGIRILAQYLCFCL